MRSPTSRRASSPVAALLALLGVLASPRAAVAAPGLVAEYSDGARRVTVIAPTPNFSLRAGESIHPAIKPAFDAVFTGAIKIVAPGKYRFAAAPGRLSIAGKPVGDAPVELAAGSHALRLDIRRGGGVDRLQLRWAGETFEIEPVPASVLEHAGAPAAAWTRWDRGRVLAAELHCRGCHGPEPTADGAPPPGRGPVLSNAGGRLRAAWLDRWLAAPHVVRADARMPVVPLSDAERRDVVAFLAGTRVEGAMNNLGLLGGAEDEQRAALVERGKKLYETIGCQACHGAGAGLRSLAAMGSKWDEQSLRVYLLSPRSVDPTGRMPSMMLREGQAAALAAFLTTSRDARLEAPVAPGDAARGRSLVQGRGCLGCHTLEQAGEALPSHLVAPAFSSLRAGRGCLAPAPPPASPRYRFANGDREALGDYLATPEVAPAPAVAARDVLRDHRCQACHEIDGPASASWHDVPPSLADTGNKLRPSWVREVVANQARVRPWMELRMPHFPLLGSLGEGFAAIAGASRDEPAEEPKPDALALREGQRAIGRGEEGLACITCHDFGAYRSGAATPAPDMISMRRRMRPEWFRRWLMDPARIAPGTQMPAFFAEADRDFARRKIDALWAALGLDKDMPLPEGVVIGEQAMKLEVGAAPRVLRSFVTGGGERSILVGFPGGVSYSFDADACRVAFAWQGEFLDVRPVWAERGGQPAVPLGPRFYVAPPERSLRVTDGAPDACGFEGYTLRKGIPTFRYRLADARVEETVTPARGGKGLAISFVIERARGDVFYVAGETPGAVIRVAGGKPDGGRQRLTPRGGRLTFSVGVVSEKKATVAGTPRAAAASKRP